MGVIALILLFPFDFSPAESANTAIRRDKGGGVDVGASGMLVTEEPPKDVFQKLLSGQGLSIELWIETASLDQEGPARIFSYSNNTWVRNFTIGQEGSDLIVRLRTTNTDRNGEPSVIAPDTLIAGKKQHVVVTYNFVNERIFFDGALSIDSEKPSGNFQNWDPSFYLIFGNERGGGRPWVGNIRYAAIYDRALSDVSIRSRNSAGDREAGNDRLPGLIAEFDFSQEGEIGQYGKLRTGRHAPRLTRPENVGKARPFFTFLNGSMLWVEPSKFDAIANIILFLPFGIIFFAIFRRSFVSAGTTIVVATICAGATSATVELLQYYLDGRTSSIVDLGANAVGSLLGAIAGWFWRRFAGATAEN